jgi:hypothetical protein
LKSFEQPPDRLDDESSPMAHALVRMMIRSIPRDFLFCANLGRIVPLWPIVDAHYFRGLNAGSLPGRKNCGSRPFQRDSSAHASRILSAASAFMDGSGWVPRGDAHAIVIRATVLACWVHPEGLGGRRS